MDLLIGIVLVTASVSLFVWHLYRRETQLQEMERNILSIHDKYTNK
jgi:hypothetical protein